MRKCLGRGEERKMYNYLQKTSYINCSLFGLHNALIELNCQGSSDFLQIMLVPCNDGLVLTEHGQQKGASILGAPVSSRVPKSRRETLQL